MSIFSRTRKSEHVDEVCCICRVNLEYLYKPANQDESLILFSYSDIEIVNICKSCGTLRHALCSSDRKKKIQAKFPSVSSGPTFFEALKGAVEGGEQEHNTFVDVLRKETKGLECPKCGSFETLNAFAKRDGSPIKMKSGRRIE
jgi:hypothetical protein